MFGNQPKLYTAAQVRRLDEIVINDLGVDGFELMTRAAHVVFEQASSVWPDKRRWLILCGAGNNAGDGYLVAHLARQAGIEAQVVFVSDPEQLRGDAARAAKQWKRAGGVSVPWKEHEQVAAFDVLIDALLGTGLDRPLEGDYLEAVQWMNRQQFERVAVDIPSGLNADTGCIMDSAVRADLTVTFIGRKRGLFTADGPDHVGRLVFDDLQVPDRAYREIPDAGILIGEKFIRQNLPSRPRNSNKGQFGHVLVVGGAPGMGGAVRLAGEAALRTGAGLVTIATHPDHAGMVWQGRPELMVKGVTGGDDVRALASRATHVAVGPGLGTSGWSSDLFRACLDLDLPLIVDADGLNLLASEPAKRRAWILTPHPGEAARLLDSSSARVQSDRVGAASLIAGQYGCVAVLKGCGTVVSESEGPYSICPLGNAGMATAGAGDVLTGVIAGLWGQGLNAGAAARLGVAVHAAAGDKALRSKGPLSMIAGDITARLHKVLN